MERAIIEIVKKLLSPIKTRVLMLASRCIVTQVDDTKKMQILQVSVLKGEELSDIERFQNYGFTSNPPTEDSEALLISICGDREHSIVIALDNRTKRLLGLKSGETAMYTDSKNYIALKEGGVVEIKNEKHIFMQVMSDFAQAMIDARTATLGGPQPLLNAKDPFVKIKQRIETFLAS